MREGAEDADYESMLSALHGTENDEGLRKCIGKVPVKISVGASRSEGERIEFIFDDGSRLLMYHHQDCCESVSIEDVNGEWDDLIGVPLNVASKRTNHRDLDYGDERWTFYTFRSIKGSVDVRWYGSSNGCYSTDVDSEFVEAGNMGNWEHD